MRKDGRGPSELRKIFLRKGFLKNAHGSCLIEMGETKVLCSASIEDKVPQFLKKSGKGWLTAEYGMIPASCTERISRESTRGRPSGRTQEIQRLIGRSLRSVIDLKKIGERTFWMDADVLQGDGGTRTAAITGCFVALAEAIEKLRNAGVLPDSPLLDYVGAVSVGMIGARPMLDLCYEEDSQAEVDLNVVMTDSGKFIEIQGTAEGKPFSKKQLDTLLAMSKKGISQIISHQKKTVSL